MDIFSDNKMAEDNSISFMCEFCGKILSTIGNLKRHVKTSKSCLQTRGENYSPAESCPDCKYKTALKANLLIHFESCKPRKIRLQKEESEEKKRLEEDIIKLKAENNVMQRHYEDMKQQLSDERSRPQVVNNQLNITFNLQLEHSQRVLSPYSDLEKEQTRLLQGWFLQSDCKRGIKGLAKVIINNILSHQGKKWMISYEPNKTAFHRKNDNKEIEIDDRAEKFFESLMPAIKGVVSKNLLKLMNDAYTPSETKTVMDLEADFKSMFEKGTPERKKIVRMIADSACTSKATLLSTRTNTSKRAKLEFCDKLPDDVIPDPNNWFSHNDPEFLAFKNSGLMNSLTPPPSCRDL
jgi:hypothetical protein